MRADSTKQIPSRKTPSQGQQKVPEKGGTTFKPPSIPIYKKPSIAPTPKQEEKKKDEKEEDVEVKEEIQSQYFDEDLPQIKEPEQNQ